MDKTQEMNIRLTLVVKALEGGQPIEMGSLKAALDWIIAPMKNTIVPAMSVVQ